MNRGISAATCDESKGLLDFFGFPLWPILVTALLSSMAGALVYAGLSTYRQRPQPIGHRVDVFPDFATPVGAICSRSQVIVSDGQQAYRHDELHLIQIYISNEGDQSFEEFIFGITLGWGDVAVFVEAQSEDRQHKVKQLTPISFAEPQSELDFLLYPFSRRDSYSLRLLVLIGDGKQQPGEISFSSPESIRFVKMPTIDELVKETARFSSISLGPFDLSFKALLK